MLECSVISRSGVLFRAKPNSVGGKAPAGAPTSTVGFCVRLPSPDPFMFQPYWFRNKSNQLIQQSTFGSKAAGRSCCVWRAAPQVAVFIVPPPPKINESLPQAKAGTIPLGGDWRGLEASGEAPSAGLFGCKKEGAANTSLSFFRLKKPPLPPGGVMCAANRLKTSRRRTARSLLPASRPSKVGGFCAPVCTPCIGSGSP